MEGFEDYKPTERDKGRVMILGKEKVIRERIPEYLSNESRAKVRFYFQWKAFGWPFSGGWAEQPAYLVDVVSFLDGEYSKWVSEHRNG